MNTYQVWLGGCFVKADNCSSKAYFLSERQADSFEEACHNAIQELVCINPSWGWKMHYYNAENNTYWGIPFYDNEADARKSFG